MIFNIASYGAACTGENVRLVRKRVNLMFTADTMAGFQYSSDQRLACMYFEDRVEFGGIVTVAHPKAWIGRTVIYCIFVSLPITTGAPLRIAYQSQGVGYGMLGTNTKPPIRPKRTPKCLANIVLPPPSGLLSSG